MIRQLMLTTALCCVGHLDAQTVVAPTSDGPDAPYWVSITLGFQEAFTIADGSTNTEWRFADAQSYSATVERRLASDLSVGLLFSHTPSTLTYVAEPAATNVPSECAIPCPATASVNQFAAVVHKGNGRGLHQVFEGSLGVTTVSVMKAKVTGNPLPPGTTSTAPTGTIAYGFGYALSDKALLEFVEQGQLILPSHRTAGTSAPRTLATLITFRLGL